MASTRMSSGLVGSGESSSTGEAGAVELTELAVSVDPALENGVDGPKTLVPMTPTTIPIMNADASRSLKMGHQ